LALTYQYDPTPGRHVKGGLSIHYGNQPPEIKYDYTNTGERDLAGVINQEVIDNAGFCMMADFGLPPGIHIKFITAVTGFEYTEEEAKNLGIRTYTIRHAFNLREGLRRKDFDISDRIIGVPPLQEGPTAGVTVDAKMLADNFFRELGWNLDDAVPTKESLERVGGLESVIKDLYPNG
jgi:aldehyde:ferredoxin oxidoreductase